jgi:hypothetical protein
VAQQAPVLTREYIHLNGHVVAVENAGDNWPSGGGNTSFTVGVVPGTVSLGPSESVQFVSTVIGNPNQSVTWTVNPAVGSITGSGFYTAPPTVSTGQTVTVRATSNADSTKSATATVTFYNPQSSGDYPLLGSFLNFYRDLTSTLWAKEYDLMQQVNMKTVVIFSVGLLKPDSSDQTGFSLSGEGLLYPSMLVDASVRPTTDRLENMLSLADQRGMDVYLGSLQTWADWSDGQEFAALRKYNRLVTQEILTRYGQHRSLRGWFFSQELWLNWIKTYGADYYGTTLLKNFVTDMRALDATKPVCAAVVFKQTGYNSMPGLTPAELQTVTTTFLQNSGVQILMPQDGAGADAGAPPLSDLPAYFQAFKAGIDAAGTRSTLWSTVETFTAVPNQPSAKFPPATATRIQQQVSNVRPFVTGYVNWIFGDDMSQQATYYPIQASALDRSYQSTFQPTAHPPLVVFSPAGYVADPPADPQYPDRGGVLINGTGGGYTGYDFSDWAAWGSWSDSNHLKITIDLGSVQWIRMIRALTMSWTDSGIYQPQYLNVEVSTDGQTYSAAVPNPIQQTWPDSPTFSIGWAEVPLVSTARYVRLTFSHNWWLFLNELQVLGVAGAPQPPPGSGVTVIPSSVNLQAGQAQQFSATVSGTTNQSVTWSLNPTTGTINSSGLYTAPSPITANQTVTITATSVADPTKSGSAIVTLGSQGGVTVGVDPQTVSLLAGQSQQFAATVAGTSNGTVTWSLGSPVGSISSSGLYTAPGTLSGQQTTTVIATSVADPTKSGIATVLVSPDPTLTSMVGPVAPDSGTGYTQTFQFNAQARSGELDFVGMIFNTTLDAAHSCLITYYPTEGDLIALSADDSTNEAWDWVGVQALGQPGTLSNSQCSVDTGASSVTRNGAAVRINLRITFTAAFQGTRQMYMAAHDTGGNLTAWPYTGYWVVP